MASIVTEQGIFSRLKLPSFLVQSAESLDQRAFPGQRTEVVMTGRDGRDWKFCASKIGPAANYHLPCPKQQ